MPGFFHRELRRVWASLNVNTGARDPVDLSVEGPALREKQTYFNRLLTRTHQLPDRAATYCLQMCGLLTDEERAVKERHGSSWTARHDTIVSCLYLRLSREFNAELEIKTHSHLHDQNQKPDIWLIDKCKTIDGRHPAPPDGPLLQREAQEAQGRDSRSSTGRTAPSTPSPGGTSKSSTWMLKSSLSGPPSPSHTWPRRPTST